MMEKYEHMKDSGYPWMGEIPVHWHDINPKALFTQRKERAKEGERQLTASQQYGVLYQDEYMALTGSRVVVVQKDFDILKHVEAGDFVISMRSFQGGLEYSPVSGSISSAYVMLIPNEKMVYPPFYKWLLKSSAYIRALQSTTDLVRDGQAMRYSNFAKVRLLVAPLSEQKAISEYLDEKVDQIDTTITEAKKTIAEYKQWRAAIITEAVTKGLSQNADEKACGLEWIDYIPGDWKTEKLKNIFSFGKGLPITKDNLMEKGIPVISYGQIHAKINPGTKVVDDLIRYVSEDYLTSNPESLVRRGDILVADTSEDLDGCGNAVYVDQDMSLFAGYHTIILKGKGNRDNKYLSYLFKTNAWRSQIRSRVTGVKLFSISRKILTHVTVILPPLEEREKIVEMLDKKCKEIDSIIAEKEELVLDLEQYKRSLIYETVTGKRKVV